MHSRVIQLAKNKNAPVIYDNVLPEWFFDLIDYARSQSPCDWEDDFRWFAKCYKGISYSPTTNTVQFNEKFLDLNWNTIDSMYVYITDGDTLYGIDPEYCLIPVYDFMELIKRIDPDGEDRVFYTISSIDYHF